MTIRETSKIAKDSEYGKSFGDLGNNKFGKDVVIVRLGNIPVVKVFPA